MGHNEPRTTWFEKSLIMNDNITIQYRPEYLAYQIYSYGQVKDPKTNEMIDCYSMQMLFESREKFNETVNKINKLWDELEKK